MLELQTQNFFKVPDPKEISGQPNDELDIMVQIDWSFIRKKHLISATHVCFLQSCRFGYSIILTFRKYKMEKRLMSLSKNKHMTWPKEERSGGTVD